MKNEPVTASDHDCEAALFAKLQSVDDPELDINIVDLGIVRKVRCDASGKTNTITMILTSPLCPFLKEMVADIKAASKDLYPQREAKVVVDMKTRWKPSFMSEQAKKQFWGGEK